MKKTIVISSILVIFAIAATILLWPYFTTHILVIKGDNIQTVSIQSGADTVSYSDLSAVRIPNDGTVTLSYTVDDEDYSDGSIVVKGSEAEVTIRPDYSLTKRQEVAKRAYKVVSARLAELYPKINLYSIAPGDVYERGSWYSTTLTYTGDYGLNSDTLRIVAKNDGDSWNLETLPEIFLTTAKYSDIPVGVLQQANKYSN